MSSRCRSCHLLVPADAPLYPPPQQMAALAPFTKTLMNAATEYDSAGVSQGELTSATEFARWIDFEARRAARDGDGSPLNLRAEAGR